MVKVGQEAAHYRPSPEVRIADNGTDLVVLDLRSDRYLAFSESAASIWRWLVEGHPVTTIATLLAQRYELPATRAEEDVRVFLAGLEQAALIEPGHAAQPREIDVPAGGADPGGDALAQRLFQIPEERRWRRGWSGLLEVARAFAVLVQVDLEMRLFGMRRLYRLVAGEDRSPGPRRGIDPEGIWGIVRAVDRAAACYFKRVWCLQRSVACAFLLRRRRVPAQLVLGVVALPFFAHAWVEIGGRPINEDNRDLLRELTVLDRV